MVYTLLEGKPGYKYRKLLKIHPHLFAHYYEAKVEKGHLLKYSISLVHTLPVPHDFYPIIWGLTEKGAPEI